MIGKGVVSLLFNLALGVSLPAGDYDACYAPGAIEAFQHSLRSTLHCAARRLRSESPVACDRQPDLECGERVLAKIVELVGGDPAATPWSEDRAKCQIAIYEGVAGFVGHRIGERRAGERRQRQSRQAFAIESACDTVLRSEAGPVVGEPCASPSRPRGERYSAPALVSCVRAELEKNVSSLLGFDDLRPNVLLVVTDDQHPAAARIALSNLERIAAQGVHFPNAFTTSPLCDPSRASILTGQNPARHGVTTNGGRSPRGVLPLAGRSTLATWFHQAGYETALIGKFLVGYFNAPTMVPDDWSEWRVFTMPVPNFFGYELNENGTIVGYGDTPNDYSTDVLAAHAGRFIDANADRPFFAYLAPFAPHSPSIPAPRHRGRLADLPPWRPPSWGVSSEFAPGWMRAFAATDKRLASQDEKIRGQLESLFAVDEALDALLAQLEEIGISDNTIVLLTTDHGLMWGEHRWVGKQTPYEESIRIPLAMQYPLGLPRRRTHDELVANIDIAPTLTALAGIQTDGDFDGRSLTDLIGGASDWRSDLVVALVASGMTVSPWTSVRTADWKYVRHRRSQELYDLRADPYETDNKIKDPAYDEQRQAMASLLSERLER